MDGAKTILETPVLTVDDVAAYLRVRPDTVRNLQRTGQLSSVKIGKHTRYLRTDLDVFIESLSGGKK